MRIHDQRGVSALEVMIGSCITAIMMASVSGITQQQQKRFSVENSRLEMQQKARAIFGAVSQLVRSAGSNRSGTVFSAPPYTTASSLPLPVAGLSSLRVRTDSNDDGTISSGLPEDVTVSWNAGSQILSVGPAAFERVAGFSLRYFDINGVEMTPPVGGWNISANADHGAVLRTIVRVRLTLDLDARSPDLQTKQKERLTMTSDVTLTNQLPV